MRDLSLLVFFINIHQKAFVTTFQVLVEVCGSARRGDTCPYVLQEQLVILTIDVAVVYHATIVESEHGQLKKFGLQGVCFI